MIWRKSHDHGHSQIFEEKEKEEISGGQDMKNDSKTKNAIAP